MQKRLHYLFIVVLCTGILGAALFLQLVAGMEPCPLCVFQRIAIISIGLIALIAFLHNSTSFIDKVYGLFLVLGGMASVGVASRHVWLLSQPKDEAAACGPGLEVSLDRFIEYLPQGEITEVLFRSGAECTEISEFLFGLGLPQLTYPVFLILLSYLVWLAFKQNK